MRISIPVSLWVLVFTEIKYTEAFTPPNLQNFWIGSSYGDSTNKRVDLRRQTDRSRSSLSRVQSTPGNSNDNADPNARLIRSAYLQWCEHYKKQVDETRYPQFVSNYKVMQSIALKGGKPMHLNDFADFTGEEYEALMQSKNMQKNIDAESVSKVSQPKLARKQVERKEAINRDETYIAPKRLVVAKPMSSANSPPPKKQAKEPQSKPSQQNPSRQTSSMPTPKPEMSTPSKTRTGDTATATENNTSTGTTRDDKLQEQGKSQPAMAGKEILGKTAIPPAKTNSDQNKIYSNSKKTNVLSQSTLTLTEGDEGSVKLSSEESTKPIPKKEETDERKSSYTSDMSKINENQLQQSAQKQQQQPVNEQPPKLEGKMQNSSPPPKTSSPENSSNVLDPFHQSKISAGIRSTPRKKTTLFDVMKARADAAEKGTKQKTEDGREFTKETLVEEEKSRNADETKAEVGSKKESVRTKAASTRKTKADEEKEAKKKAEEERKYKEVEARRKADEERKRLELEAKKKAEEEQKQKEADAKAKAEARRKADEERKRLELEAKKKAEEEQKQKEADAKAKAEARRKADEERKRLELEAKKKAEEERKQKEAEAKAKAEARRKADEERKRLELEAKKKAEEEQKQKEAEAKAKAEARRKADEERKRLELEAKKKAEEEAKRKEAEAKAKAEARRKADEERKRLELEAKKKAEEEAKRKEAEAKAKAEARRKADEERKRLELEAKRKADEERQRKEAEAKAKAEARRKAEEERKRIEAEAKAKAEAEAEAKRKAEEERKQREAEAKAKAEAEAKRKAEEERKRIEAEAKRKAEEERKRIEAEAKAKAEAEAKRKAEEERKRIEAEAKAKAEAEAKRKAEEERKRIEAEAKAKAEAEAEARRKAEEERKRIEAEAKAKAEAEARRKAEEERKRIEAVAKAKAEAEAEARRKAEEERKRIEAEAKAKAEAEAEARRKAEEERKRIEAEAKAKAEAEAEARRKAEEERKRIEAEAKAKAEAEAEARRKAEEERKRIEAEAKAEAEAEARRKAEEERKRIEAEAKAKAEAEAEAKRKAEEERKRIEAEAKAKAEAEARRKAEEERKRTEAEAEAKRKVEEERKRIEAEAKAEAEAEAKRKVELERKRILAEAKAKAEAEALAKTEAEARQKKAEALRLRIEAEEKARAVEEEKKKIEEEKQRMEVEAKAKAELEAKQKKAEAVRLRIESEEKARAIEQEKEKVEDAKAKAKAELEAKRKTEEIRMRIQGEEISRAEREIQKEQELEAEAEATRNTYAEEETPRIQLEPKEENEIPNHENDISNDEGDDEVIRKEELARLEATVKLKAEIDAKQKVEEEKRKIEEEAKSEEAKKIKAEEEAEDAKRKEEEDELRIRAAYLDWCLEFAKKPDKVRMKQFKQNYLMLEGVAKEEGKEIKLNEYADYTGAEYQSEMKEKQEVKKKEQEERLKNEQEEAEAAFEAAGGKVGTTLVEEESNETKSNAFQQREDNGLFSAEEEVAYGDSRAEEVQDEWWKQEEGLDESLLQTENTSWSLMNEGDENVDTKIGNGARATNTTPDVDADDPAVRKRVRTAYSGWCRMYNKEPDEARFPKFKSNYLIMERLAKKQGREVFLNEFADCTPDEYEKASRSKSVGFSQTSSQSPQKPKTKQATSSETFSANAEPELVRTKRNIYVSRETDDEEVDQAAVIAEVERIAMAKAEEAAKRVEAARMQRLEQRGVGVSREISAEERIKIDREAAKSDLEKRREEALRIEANNIAEANADAKKMEETLRRQQWEKSQIGNRNSFTQQQRIRKDGERTKKEAEVEKVVGRYEVQQREGRTPAFIPKETPKPRGNGLNGRISDFDSEETQPVVKPPTVKAENPFQRRPTFTSPVKASDVPQSNVGSDFGEYNPVSWQDTDTAFDTDANPLGNDSIDGNSDQIDGNSTLEQSSLMPNGSTYSASSSTSPSTNGSTVSETSKELSESFNTFSSFDENDQDAIRSLNSSTEKSEADDFESKYDGSYFMNVSSNTDEAPQSFDYIQNWSASNQDGSDIDTSKQTSSTYDDQSIANESIQGDNWYSNDGSQGSPNGSPTNSFGGRSSLMNKGASYLDNLSKPDSSTTSEVTNGGDSFSNGVAPQENPSQAQNVFPERIKAAYRDWCQYYGKEYNESRLSTFSSNFLAVERYHRETGVSLILNELADMSSEEFQQNKN